MAIKDKLPLINNISIGIRIDGYVLYFFLALILLGAIMPYEAQEADESSARQTGQIEYATPQGTVTVNLPAGFYLVNKFGAEGTWVMETAKTASDCTCSHFPGRATTFCPGHELLIMWGKLGNSGEDLEWWINFFKKSIGNDGGNTKTASGQMAWWVARSESTNGWYGALVDYSDDKSKWLSIIVQPIPVEGSPSQSMTPREFKNFVESINIISPAIPQSETDTQTVSGEKKDSLDSDRESTPSATMSSTASTKTAYTRDGKTFVSKERMEENIKAHVAERGDYEEVQVPLDTPITGAFNS